MSKLEVLWVAVLQVQPLVEETYTMLFHYISKKSLNIVIYMYLHPTPTALGRVTTFAVVRLTIAEAVPLLISIEPL